MDETDALNYASQLFLDEDIMRDVQMSAAQREAYKRILAAAQAAAAPAQPSDAALLDFLDRPFVNVLGCEPDVQRVDVEVGQGRSPCVYRGETVRDALRAAIAAEQGDEQ